MRCTRMRPHHPHPDPTNRGGMPPTKGITPAQAVDETIVRIERVLRE